MSYNMWWDGICRTSSFIYPPMDAVLSYKTQKRTLRPGANTLLESGFVGIFLHIDIIFDKYVSLSGQ